MSDEPDTVMLGGTLFWIHRAYRPQPVSDHMLPECENPPDPPSASIVFGGRQPRRREKIPVKQTYDILNVRLR